VTHETLENLSQENRKFPPSAEFAAQANGKADLYDAAAADHEGFWAEQARKYLTWTTDFDQTLDWSDAPLAKWFVGGELNASYNCVDRHVEAGNGDKVAIHFVGEPGDTRDITYSDLFSEVQRAANALENLGVRKGDRVAIYLPMIPGDRHHDAGLRADRRPALGRLRWLLRRTPCAPGSVTPRPRSS